MSRAERWRRGATVGTLPVALLALLTLGLRDGSLGVAWPSIRTTFHQPLSSLGLLLLLANAGYLVSSSTSGRVTARVGAGRLLSGASATAALALAAYCVAPRWPLLLAAAPVLGLANGIIDAGVNSHVAKHHDVRAMGLIHASYGIGATLGPILVTAVLSAGAGWRIAFATLTAVEALLAARWFVTRRAWSVPPAALAAPAAPAAPAASAAAAAPAPPPARVHRALLPLSLAVFFLYTGLELAAGAWAFSLLREGWRLGPTAAGAWVASYWAALTAGRLLLGLAGHRTTTDRLLRWSTAASLAGAVLLWVRPTNQIGVIGLPLLGLGLAAVFPALVSATPARHGLDRANTVIGYQLAAAGVGGTALAGLAGLVASRLGLLALGPYLTGGAAFLLVAVELTAIVARRPSVEDRTKMEPWSAPRQP
jgi:fucose permease